VLSRPDYMPMALELAYNLCHWAHNQMPCVIRIPPSTTPRPQGCPIYCMYNAFTLRWSGKDIRALAVLHIASSWQIASTYRTGSGVGSKKWNQSSFRTPPRPKPCSQTSVSPTLWQPP